MDSLRILVYFKILLCPSIQILWVDVLYLYFCNALGNFNGTIINLGGNNIKKFDEEVFKPLLTHSTATIQITDGNTHTILYIKDLNAGNILFSFFAWSTPLWLWFSVDSSRSPPVADQNYSQLLHKWQRRETIFRESRSQDNERLLAILSTVVTWEINVLVTTTKS